MARKVYEETYIANIADKIREKTGGDNTYKTSQMPSGIDAVYEKGKQAEWSAFWDSYQNNGNRRIYENYFRAAGWTDDTYNPKYEIYAESLGALFHGSGVADTKVPITYTGKYNSTNVFYNCRNLVTIRYLNFIDNPTHSNYSNWFYNCDALENITIGGVVGNNISFQQSKKLSKASITSIINALSNTTSGLTVTLSKTAVNKAFETSEGAGDGSTSDEWLALIATKQNWTISLA